MKTYRVISFYYFKFFNDIKSKLLIMSRWVLPHVGIASCPASSTIPIYKAHSAMCCSLQIPSLCHSVSYSSIFTHAAHLASHILPKSPMIPLPQIHHLPGRPLLATASVKQSHRMGLALKLANLELHSISTVSYLTLCAFVSPSPRCEKE